MCGRTCLTLAANDLQLSCTYKCQKDNVYKKPDFRYEYNGGKTYEPSFNIAPTDVCPVLVSAAHFDEECPTTDRLLVPMMWSIIPYWHKGDYRKHGLTTNNCRLETMEQSKLYKNALAKGQRCVVLCEGFYEWKTTADTVTKSSERDVYYFFMPQKPEIDISNNGSWNPEDINLLKIAGLFDIWTNECGDSIYSYSVITFESDESFNWLHHRSPAILDTEQQVTDWLDFERIPSSNVRNLLKPAKHLKWYQVSKVVNNSRNKSEQCNKPINRNKSSDKELKRTSLLDNWLKAPENKISKISN